MGWKKNKSAKFKTIVIKSNMWHVKYADCYHIKCHKQSDQNSKEDIWHKDRKLTQLSWERIIWESLVNICLKQFKTTITWFIWWLCIINRLQGKCIISRKSLFVDTLFCACTTLQLIWFGSYNRTSTRNRAGVRDPHAIFLAEQHCVHSVHLNSCYYCTAD